MRPRPATIFTLLLLTTIIALGFGAPTEASAIRPKVSSRPKSPGKLPPDLIYRVDHTRPLERPTKGNTPYDQYLSSVWNVLQKLDGRNPPSMEKVHILMQEAFQFEYSMTSAYKPKSPAVVEERRAGDCKDKALWLANRMNDPGIRYVIGKQSQNQSLNHAWLLWRHDSQWWVLDPTFSDIPLPEAGFGGAQHIPYYAYTREGAYRYRTTELKPFGAGVHDRHSGRSSAPINRRNS